MCMKIAAIPTEFSGHRAATVTLRKENNRSQLKMTYGDDNFIAQTKHSNLPRLLYVGDVSVESSYHGSALLYRLLQNYPGARLLIIEGNLSASRPERRLPGVRYATLRVGNTRWLRTRLAPWYSSWLTLASAARLKRAEALLDGFQPDAVLTVTHGYSWITAAQLAARRGVRLYLICHDDWPRVVNFNGLVKKRLEATFGAIYRQAVSRLCVSPFMCEVYRERYGRDGTLLFPSRAADCPTFDAPPERLSRNDHPFTVAFGGTINSRGYVRSLTTLAETLEAFGGRLLIFGPLTPNVASKAGLARPNITLRGLVPSGELMARFREEADALFVPMSFDSAERGNMEAAFPSKLTDYTAVGLPLLIYGPAYCSAVRWARGNCGVAAVVDNEDPQALAEAVRRMAESPEDRIALGKRALEAGQRYFTREAAERIFHRTLVLPRDSAP